MKAIWGRPLSTVVLIGIAALVSWPIFGSDGALLILSALLLVLLFHHLINLSALYHWLQNQRRGNVPVGTGAWEYVFSHLLRMLRRHGQSEVRLNEALSRFQLAGAALPDAVVVLGEGDRIEWCNPKAESYFGLDNQRDRGQQITYILRQPQFVKHLASGQVGESLVLPISREQGDIVLSVQLVPFGDRQKLLLGRDITRWERLETTRRDFVANVSHELRTPLTVVGGFLETLSDTKNPDPEMMQRWIVLMSQQTGRMTRLVDDLLTLSRLESTHNPVREEDVNVPDLVKALHQDAMSLSAGRHKLRVKVDSNDWLRGNTEELRSAFGNVISNAVRYTPENGEVEIRWETREGRPVFAVRDTGIGIEPQHIDRLTERFYRVDRSRSRETGGTGLGLAIVKHVLNRHQARLDVQSNLGSGSTFSVIFPETRRLAAKGPAAAAVQETAISR